MWPPSYDSCCSAGGSSDPSTPVKFGGTQTDAFGRLRVSQPYTLFDSQNRYKLNSKFVSNTATGGTVNYIQAQSAANLYVTGTLGSSVIRESRQVFPYQPGKSLFIMMTLVMNQSKSGLRQRVGYFGSDNGYNLELSDQILSIVERSNVYGTITTTAVPQSSWNYDALNGTGISGITLDITKSQIFWIDMEWLGVGSVRTGFVINGQFSTCHVFHHANMIPTTYITTAVLPIRYEITNTGTTSGSSNLMQICSTVLSEGGYAPKEVLHVQSRGDTQVSTGIVEPLISIRLKAGRLDSVVVIKQISIAVKTNSDVSQWFLVVNGTPTTGTSWVNHPTSDSVQYDISSTAITGGSNVYSGFAQTGSPTTSLSVDTFELQLGRDSFTQVSDVVTLCAVGSTTNPHVFSSISWAELV